ncbi:hypothetical protein [Streptacidiphilus jiangxiensis]|uniref:Uncharacterized protein n=1 Tax=Streptacidiphilus jiangxiensis TaxID=235985 RepID=A0A1H7FCH5_STRJI|nr:hypothetical protein [Streptacidiphilus jiangxiensis]SEK23688.1 hypothetical protein SAMN05414137_101193 [Streptacidiphilus jiangxiensis]
MRSALPGSEYTLQAARRPRPAARRVRAFGAPGALPNVLSGLSELLLVDVPTRIGEPSRTRGPLGW